MNPKLAYLLTHLYPRPWRKRYGAEFEALLQVGRGDLRTLVNVAWSALCERIIPTQGPDMNQHSRSFQFQSWCVRAPWAIFGLAPLFLLAVAYFVVCFILWTGWQVFLPGADTPFGHPNPGPIYGFQNMYFQAGKFFYFGAPVLIGWGIGLIAARQRVKAVWPIVGLVLIALMGAANQVHASRTEVPSGLGHIRIDFLAMGTSGPDIYRRLFQALMVLSLTVMPYLIWRLQKARSFCA